MLTVRERPETLRLQALALLEQRKPALLLYDSSWVGRLLGVPESRLPDVIRLTFELDRGGYILGYGVDRKPATLDYAVVETRSPGGEEIQTILVSPDEIPRVLPSALRMLPPQHGGLVMITLPPTSWQHAADVVMRRLDG